MVALTQLTERAMEAQRVKSSERASRTDFGDQVIPSDTGAEQVGQSPAIPQPEDEPSAQWGWHGTFPHGSIIAGWTTAAILLTMLVTHILGSHSEGHVADVYLAVIAAGMILLLIRHTMRAHHSSRR